MDFELSADQVALRDGIRSLCEGRFPIKRVRDGFDRAAHAELAEAGVFSLRSDGFGVADKPLGRFRRVPLQRTPTSYGVR